MQVFSKQRRFFVEGKKDLFGFIENWNLQSTPSQGSGVLFIVNWYGVLKLGIVVKIDRQSCVCLALVSKHNNMDAFVAGLHSDWKKNFTLTLFDASKTFARTLQQVCGRRLCLARATSCSYPFLGKDGFVSTTPILVDILKTPSQSMLPNFVVHTPDEDVIVSTQFFSEKERETARKKACGHAFTIFVLESPMLKMKSQNRGVVGVEYGVTKEHEM